MKVSSEYEKQAQDFLEKTNTTFHAEFFGHGLYFDDDKEQRDIYTITLTRDKKKMVFKFGQSITNSGLTVQRNPHKVFRKTLYDVEMIPRKGGRVIPTAYDVLTCLTKYDPGSFENFCGEFGYDTDSKKAEKTYFAVQKEYYDLCKLFSQDELAQMAEIQ